MSEFDMDFDKAVRKASRLDRNKQQPQEKKATPVPKQRTKQQVEQERREKHERSVTGAGKSKVKPVTPTGGGGAQSSTPNQPEEQLEHTNERDDVRDESRIATSSTSTKSTEPTSKSKVSNMREDVRQFKDIPNLFTYVGGSKHVELDTSYKKVQVTGLPEALVTYNQAKLKEKYTGRLVTFPWGDYEITDTNKVFNARTSYMRYVLFSALRDVDATHVILAKQWLVLHHPMVYSEHYDMSLSYQVHDDELDIYALTYAVYLDELEMYGVTTPKVKDPQTDESNALYIGMSTLRKMMQEQQMFLQNFTELFRKTFNGL